MSLVGSLSGSSMLDGSESSSNEESSSDDTASNNKGGDVEVLGSREVVTSLEVLPVDKDARLAMPILILAVIPPSSASASTSENSSISLASNHYIGLPAQSPMSSDY